MSSAGSDSCGAVWLTEPDIFTDGGLTSSHPGQHRAARKRTVARALGRTPETDVPAASQGSAQHIRTLQPQCQRLHTLIYACACLVALHTIISSIQGRSRYVCPICCRQQLGLFGGILLHAHKSTICTHLCPGRRPLLPCATLSGPSAAEIPQTMQLPVQHSSLGSKAPALHAYPTTNRRGRAARFAPQAAVVVDKPSTSQSHSNGNGNGNDSAAYGGGAYADGNKTNGASH